ncbi:MAG: hypothetical protein GTO18_17475 [Anaerolineales bacterium]|nr:hypothetical protein [Anaerolineales bacterium]
MDISAYSVLLALHNFTRWAVLILGLFAIGQVLYGWIKDRPWTSAHRRAGQLYTISLDIQLLIGILLVFFSPIVEVALSNFSAALETEQLRFFIIEHIPLMVIAIVLAHIGNARAKKVEGDRNRHKQALIWYSLSLAGVILAIPWWRPLLPWIG